MAGIKPGQSTGKNGGIFQEGGPRGGMKDNFAAIPDNRQAPPTQNKGSEWVTTSGRLTARVKCKL